MIIEELKQNPSFVSTNDILMICDPLFKHLRVNYFRFLRIYQDGSRIILTTNIEWLKDFFNKQYYTIAWTDSKPAGSFSESYLLWDEKAFTDDNVVGIDNRNLYNMHHGLTIIKNFKNFSEYYDFTTDVQMSCLNKAYVQHMDIFERFILFFKDKANKIINKCEKTRINIPHNFNINLNQYQPNRIIDEKVELLFTKDTPINRFYLDSDDNTSYLTPREIECIYWTLEGKTSCEIAIILGLSSRSIEVYLYNIQLRFNCMKKPQLVAKLKNLGIDKIIKEYLRKPNNSI